MRIRSLFVPLLCLGAGFLNSCASGPATTKLPVSMAHVTANPTADRIFETVNEYRRSQGLQALHRHSGLDKLAQEHCIYLRDHRGSFSLKGRNVSHMGFDGRAQYAQRMFHMFTVGENVAASEKPGANPAGLMVDLWKQSPAHHKAMIDAWTHTGVGVVVDKDGAIFATQLFATASVSQLDERQRFDRH
jgi:uncharacterized protein YkwD